ncbi:MAG: TAXI family TRAP transporter solute-binding subunit [Betaproteobacteria bacterium]|jgi:TRAP transporter TAXI family solute receptor|nr:TAXI family TRAP transporter solute-binding subunit [Betaproteobacteria bacterium]
MDIYKLSKKTLFTIFGAILFAIVGAIISIWLLVPPLPKSIVIATGSPTGLYHRFGESLKEELKKEGITVELRNTKGSVENLQLLSDPHSGVDLGLAQTGTANETDYPKLASIAGVFYEPYWVWYRTNSFKEGGGFNSVNQLKGKKIAIGASGSGANLLTRELFKLHSIDEQQLTILEIGPDVAKDQLRSGEIDVVAFTVGLEAPIINQFAAIPGVAIVDFNQGEAYSRKLPYLTQVKLPHGNVSLEHNQPPRDIHLIAATAVLVGRENIAPGFVNVLMGNLYELLKNYSRMQTTGEFPSNRQLDLPQVADAEIYMKDGPSFLYRHLPFWLAVWVGRLLKVLVPLLAIGIPLFSYLPALYDFRLKLTLGKSYVELKGIEQKAFLLYRGDASANDVHRLLEELERFDMKIDKLDVPTLETQRYFDMRAHVNVVRLRLYELLQAPIK